MKRAKRVQKTYLVIEHPIVLVDISDITLSLVNTLPMELVLLLDTTRKKIISTPQT